MATNVFGHCTFSEHIISAVLVFLSNHWNETNRLRFALLNSKLSK